MNNKKIAIFLIFVVIISGTSIYLWQAGYFEHYALPIGQDPILNLPFTNSSNLWLIQPFGQLTSSFYHTGIDYDFNGSVIITAPTNGTVDRLEFGYNEKGGHWQTNLFIILNKEWLIIIGFESWAETEAKGKIQLEEIVAKVGVKVQTGDKLGTLLNHGTGCHIHFSLRQKNIDVCSYNYLSPDAKVEFDTLFARVDKMPGIIAVCN